MPSKTQQIATRTKFFQQRIRHHRGAQEAELKEWARDLRAFRNMAWGEGQDDTTDGSTVQVPYINSFIDVMVSNIVPPHPAVDIRARRKAKRQNAKLRTAYVKDQMAKDHVVWKMRRAAALASLMGRSMLKVVWSSKRKRPRLRVLPANRFFFDDTAEEWDESRYVIEIVPMTRGDIQKRAKNKNPRNRSGVYAANVLEQLEGKFQKMPSYLDDPSKSGQSASRSEEEYVIVYEVHDFEQEKMFHIVEDCEEPLFEGDLPYPRLKKPYHLVVLMDNLTDLGGLSHSQMIREPVSRLNELMTMSFEHTRMMAPFLFIHKELVDNAEDVVSAMGKRTSVNQAIAVETRRNVRMEDVFEWSKAPSVPFQYQQMSGVLQEIIEFVLALPSYSRGQVGNADIATEVAMVDTATKTRNAPLQGVINDAMEWTSFAYLSISSMYIDREGMEDIYLKLGEFEEEENKADLESLDLMTEDGQWDYDYRAFPYNASEDNSTVRLKKLEAFQDILLNSPHVEQREVIIEILEALGATHLVKTVEAMQREQTQQQAAQAQEATALDPNAGAVLPHEMEGVEGGEILAPGGEDVQPALPPASGGTIPTA